MKKSLLLLLPVFILLSCNPPKEPTAKELIMSIASHYSNHKSISYYVNYSIKVFSQDKPYNYPAHCQLIRELKDSVFNGYILLSFPDYGGYEKYYDLNKIYYIGDTAKKIKEYDDPKHQSWIVEGNLTGETKDIYFLKPFELIHIAKDSTIIDSLTVDKIGYADYWKLTIKFPDDKEISERWKSIWVDRNDTTIKRIYYHAKYQGQEEYKQWDIDSVVFDNLSPESLRAQLKDKFAAYTTTQYVPHPADYYDLLKNGTLAPAFSGMDFETGKAISSAQYKGKVMLLDFWYMDCPWCITAMPDIEKIQDRFKSKGLIVLGLNHYDTSAKAKARLPGFRAINKMNYPAVLTSHVTDSLYLIKAYPTIYLINKKGKIVFSQMGYKKGLDSLLDGQIKRELSN